MAYFIIQKDCTQCRNCLQVCMNNAFVDLGNELYINPVWCIECGSCAAMCYENAIGYEGLDQEKEDIFDEGNVSILWHLLVNSDADAYLITDL